MAKRKKRYRYKLRFKLLFWSLIAMIAFSIVNIFLNRPSTATIIKPTLEDMPTQAEVEKTNVISSRYFQMIYDAGLDTISDISASDKTAMEVYRLARSDETGRRTLVITVKSLPGGMSEESSYKLRNTNPETYRLSNENFGELAFVIFEKADKTEITGFVSKGDYFAMLAYTLGAPSEDIYEDAKKLFQNFRWNN